MKMVRAMGCSPVGTQDCRLVELLGEDGINQQPILLLSIDDSIFHLAPVSQHRKWMIQLEARWYFLVFPRRLPWTLP